MNTLLDNNRVPNILNHVLKISQYLQDNSRLKNAFIPIVNSQDWVKLSWEDSFKLEALGLVTRKTESSGDYARIKNTFYREYFRDRLDS